MKKFIIILLCLASTCFADNFNSSLKPKTDSTIDIGTSSLLWRKVWADAFSDGTFLVSSGVFSAGTWQADNITVPFGGTGKSSFTDGGILIGAGTDPITSLGLATNGQIPIGDGATDPVLATITAVANETDVTNGAGSITIGIVTSPTLDATNFTGVSGITGLGTQAQTLNMGTQDIAGTALNISAGTGDWLTTGTIGSGAITSTATVQGTKLIATATGESLCLGVHGTDDIVWTTDASRNRLVGTRYFAGTGGIGIANARARGTEGTPLSLNDNDLMSRVRSKGWDSGGSVFADSFFMEVRADGAHGSGSVPSKVQWYTTPSASTTPTLGMELDKNGLLTLLQGLDVGGDLGVTGNTTLGGSATVGANLTVNFSHGGGGVILRGKQANGPLIRGGFITWEHGDGSETSTDHGSTFVNDNGQIVFKSIVQTTATDTGNAYIDLGSGKIWTSGEIEIDGALNHDGSTAGFYGTAPITIQTLAADPTNAEISTVLFNLGFVQR